MIDSMPEKMKKRIDVMPVAMPNGSRRRPPPRRKIGSSNLTAYQGRNEEETKE